MRLVDLFFDCLSFLVSHIFLVPVFLGAVEVWLCLRFGWPAIGTLAVLNALYATTYFDKATYTGKRFRAWFTEIWLGCHQYFPVRTLIWDGKRFADDPNDGHDKVFKVFEQTYVFGLHPHGAIPVGAAVFRPQISRWKAINEQLRFGAASAVFWLPIVRDFYLWFGAVDASKRCLKEQLAKGKSIVILPGGIQEQLWVCKPGEDVVILSKHVGFIKLALETGSPLVPVYLFGERRGYIVQERLTRFVSKILKKLFNVGVPMVRGRWFTLMPFPTRITIVIGAPIPVPPMPKATEEVQAAVEDLTKKYRTALKEMYDQHREAAGYGDTELVIR